MADEDNFDIDIYGDESGQNYVDAGPQDTAQTDSTMDTDPKVADSAGAVKSEDADVAITTEGTGEGANGDGPLDNGTQQISSTNASANNQTFQKQAPQQQGTKRKQGEDDDRPMDPGATAALMINDLNWWISEEDIRGWANQSGCEDELNEITFNEHKVNGKSKGSVPYFETSGTPVNMCLQPSIRATAHSTSRNCPQAPNRGSLPRPSSCEEAHCYIQPAARQSFQDAAQGCTSA
jgi:hypothetical protein